MNKNVIKGFLNSKKLKNNILYGYIQCYLISPNLGTTSIIKLSGDMLSFMSPTDAIQICTNFIEKPFLIILNMITGWIINSKYIIITCTDGAEYKIQYK